MAQVRFPFQAHCLKAVSSTFCGSEPWAGPADCAAYYASSLTSLANREATLCGKRFGYNVIRGLLGFYPITQSSTVPIVLVDAMSRLPSALWLHILNSTTGSWYCVQKIDLENGDRSRTSVFALSARENSTAGRWKSAARAIADMNCTVRPKAAIHDRICGSTQQRRWSIT